MEGRTPHWAAPRKPLPPPPPHFTTHLGWCDALLSQGWGRILLTCQVPTAPQNLPFLLLSLFLGQLCHLPAALWGGQQPQCQAARGWWSHRAPASSASAPTNTSLYPTSCDRDRKLSCRRPREEFKPLGTSHNSSLRALAGALVAGTGGTD